MLNASNALYRLCRHLPHAGVLPLWLQENGGGETARRRFIRLRVMPSRANRLDAAA